MIELVGALVSTVIVAVDVRIALSMLVNVDRSTREHVVGWFAATVSPFERRVRTSVAYALLTSGLIGAVQTTLAVVRWL